MGTTLLFGIGSPSFCVTCSVARGNSWLPLLPQNNEMLPNIRQGKLDGWQPIEMPRPAAYSAVGFDAATSGWAFGGIETAFWNGHVWTEQTVPEELRFVRSVQFESSSDGWAVGDHGVLLHWDGSTWTKGVTPTDADDVLVGVDFASPHLGWAVGKRDPMLQPSTLRGTVLQWNGQEWSRLEDFPASYPMSFVRAYGPTEAWTNGRASEILHWTGQAWELVPIDAPDMLAFYDMAIVDSNDAWMVGETLSYEGSIWHWDGRTWAEIQRTRLPVYSISMVSSNFGWAAGGRGLWKKIENGSLLLHWNGVTWSEYPIQTTTPLRVVWAESEKDGWLFGGGPTDLIEGEYPGVAFRYQVSDGEPTLAASAQTMDPITATATLAPAATVEKSPTPTVAASTTKLTPETPTVASKIDPMAIGIAAVAILVLGALAYGVFWRRKG